MITDMHYLIEDIIYLLTKKEPEDYSTGLYVFYGFISLIHFGIQIVPVILSSVFNYGKTFDTIYMIINNLMNLFMAFSSKKKMIDMEKKKKSLEQEMQELKHNFKLMEIKNDKLLKIKMLN
jgi:hypothetical protein